MTTASSEKYCVIGAGAAGLAVVKTFQSLGVPCECLEQNNDVGGIWNYGTKHSSVYKSTHLISSKRYAEFIDFPMPDHYPAYPSHSQVLDYLRSFASHFDLYKLISLGTTVQHVEPLDIGCEVTVAGEAKPRRYAGVVVANGHLWSPVIPDFPGTFAGMIMHARDYKTYDQLVGRRVLIVGVGNSGCDIAVESGRHALATFQSMRRGHYFVPKFLFGTPIDSGSDLLYRLQAPHWVHRLFASIPLQIALGNPREWGLPIPDHKFLDEPPIPNSDLLNAVGHGRVHVKPGIAQLRGDYVRFNDGSEEQIDVIVLATGYRIHFPFLSSQHWDENACPPQLFLNAFHPRLDNLMFAGLFDASVKTWELVEHQAQLMVHFIKARQVNNASVEWFRQLKAHPEPSRGVETDTRRFLYREYFAYRRQISRLLKRFQKVSLRTSQ